MHYEKFIPQDILHICLGLHLTDNIIYIGLLLTHITLINLGGYTVVKTPIQPSNHRHAQPM